MLNIHHLIPDRGYQCRWMVSYRRYWKVRLDRQTLYFGSVCLCCGVLALKDLDSWWMDSNRLFFFRQVFLNFCHFWPLLFLQCERSYYPWRRKYFVCWSRIMYADWNKLIANQTRTFFIPAPKLALFQALYEHPAISEVAVFAMPDARLGS